MYSNELDEYMRKRNWVLTKEEYLYVTDLNQHIQISRITYNSFEDSFTIYTKDGFSWTIRVKGETIYE